MYLIGVLHAGEKNKIEEVVLHLQTILFSLLCV